MRRIAILGLLTLLAVLAMPTASAHVELYLDPQNSSVPNGYCNTTVVRVMANITGADDLWAGQIGIHHDQSCANITGFEWGANVNGYASWYNCDSDCYGTDYDWIAFNCYMPYTNTVVELAKFTFHCNCSDCDCDYCKIPLNFSCGEMTCSVCPIEVLNIANDNLYPANTTLVDGTIECGTPKPDLVVDIIDPKYIFAGLNNSLFATVTNQGLNATSGSFNVSVQIINGTDPVFTNNVTCGPLAAGESTLVKDELFLGYWDAPVIPASVTITVTADSNNTEIECDETNNARVETRTYAGDCTTDTMLAESCYGYRGQNPLTEVYSGTGGVIYTIGDHASYSQTASFNIGGATPDTNQVDGGPADIPPHASVTKATLYVYSAWRNAAAPDPTGDFEMSIDGGGILPTENWYADCKGFSTSYTYHQYLTMAYDVTANVTGNGTYNAERHNFTSGTGYTYAMALMVTYDNCNCTYSIAHGYDRIATLYWGSNRWQYYVSPENATTTATLPDVDPDDISDSNWFTVAIDTADGTTDGEYQKINDCSWDAGAWLKDAGSYLSFDRTSGCISAAGTDEVVSAKEGWKQSGNGLGLVFACLLTKDEPGTECLGDCYEDAACGGTSIEDDVTCDYCVNTLGKYWKPNMDSNCYDGKTPWDMCMDWCPECCDSQDNDGDGGTDYPADGQCTCGLDPSETDPACPVPELATFTLVGIGLMMFAGVVLRRKE